MSRVERVDYFLNYNVQPMDLWDAVSQFADNQSRSNFRIIYGMLGFTTNPRVLAVALTFPALACPDKVPMIDKQVARWVNKHFAEHNIKFNFNLNYTSLRETDFDNYLNWVAWCREISTLLTKLTREKWRPRDVEMAVFTAQRNTLMLNPLVRC